MQRAGVLGDFVRAAAAEVVQKTRDRDQPAALCLRPASDDVGGGRIGGGGGGGGGRCVGGRGGGGGGGDTDWGERRVCSVDDALSVAEEQVDRTKMAADCFPPVPDHRSRL